MNEWPKITDHVWRGSSTDRGCRYAGCGQPLAEHEAARLPKGKRADTRAARRAAAGRCVA